MDEIKNSINPKNVLQISKALQKIGKVIERQKKEQGKVEVTSIELNFLKEQCLSNNIQLSLLSCQTLWSLIESGIIEPAPGLTMFIALMASSSSSAHLTAIGEAIINILLLDLKIALIHSKSNNTPYICPFGLKTAQHPIITLLQKKHLNVMELMIKIGGIHNHSDEQIRANSLEFLRPVYTYAFCIPNKIDDSIIIWNGFLEQRSNNVKCTKMIYDVFRWSRITPEKCHFIATQLVDIIKISLSENNLNAAIDFEMYLIALVPSLLELGYDPKNYFDLVIRTIQANNESSSELIDYNLISIAQIVHAVSPFYLYDALRVIKVLTEKDRITKNYIAMNMVLDALILRLAINGKNLPSKIISLLDGLIKQISKQISNCDFMSSKSAEITSDIVYFHPTLAFNWTLTQYSSKLCEDLSKQNESAHLKRFIEMLESNRMFSEEIYLFVRAILLSDKIQFDVWLKLFQQLLASAKSNPDISCDSIYFVLFHLATETDGRKQLELLRSLTTFASVKENIPLILNTYRSLSTSSSMALRNLTIDLHTRLWRVESRTYQFLQKILIADDATLSKTNQWESNIAKAAAIKEICSITASQHGTDLVAPLSKILNNSADNDLARSWTLDAIILLCKSHTVNVSSTWKVLQRAFEAKSDIRTTKSLCEFFGEVPLLKSPTQEYEQLFKEALKRLWSFVTNSDEKVIIESALVALRNFDFTELTLHHIPGLFFEDIRIPREFQRQIDDSKLDPDTKPLTVADVMPYIPGECWIEFIQKINQNASEAAIEFVSHLIETEMLQYRSGVYMLPEGRPEPGDVNQLHPRSPLRALIRYIKEQTEWNTEASLVAKCLQCIGKKYSRPMPPLNWFFLLEYIGHASKFTDSTPAEQFEMRMQALTIASYQTAHSGSARNLIENYLQQSNANGMDLEETLLFLKLIPNICFGVTPRILAAYLQKTLKYLYEHSASSQFEKNCHFEQAISALAGIFELKCPVTESVDIVIDELCKFNEMLDGQWNVYGQYAKYLLKIPTENFDRLSSPPDWNISSFRRSLVFRIKAVENKKPFTNSPNPWMWLNMIIDNVSDNADPVADQERKEVLLSKISNLLLKDTDDASICDWIVYLLGKVQYNFTSDESNSRIENSLFCLDLFIYCIVFTSGCAVFLTDGSSLKNRLQWLNKLPEALWLLAKRKHWTQHMPRIFEFLNHMNSQSSILPKEYVKITGRSLVCLKNHQYFLQKSNWIKFISLQV